jgi:hypothetical protein
MKKMSAIVPIAALLLAGPFAYAGENQVIVHAGLDRPLLLAQAASKAGTADKDPQQVQEHMGMMQQKMDKYHASKDAKERRQLMNEITKDMRDHMKMMHGPGGKGSRGIEGDMKKRQEMMETRMDQMHQMMEWMFTFQSDFPISAP